MALGSVLRRVSCLLAVGAGLLLSGCEASCRDVCSNTAEVCAGQLDPSFDESACVTACSNLYEGVDCPAGPNAKACRAEATDCATLLACPACSAVGNR